MADGAGSASILLERDAELAELSAAFDQARAGVERIEREDLHTLRGTG
jgi:hypothetical protein